MRLTPLSSARRIFRPGPARRIDGAGLVARRLGAAAGQFGELRRNRLRRLDVAGLVAMGDGGEREAAGERESVERFRRDDAGRTAPLAAFPGRRCVQRQGRRGGARRARPGLASGSRATASSNQNSAPSPGRAFDPDAPAARLDPPPRDGEPEAAAAETRRDIRPALHESLENPALRLLVDPDAGVAGLEREAGGRRRRRRLAAT